MGDGVGPEDGKTASTGSGTGDDGCHVVEPALQPQQFCSVILLLARLSAAPTWGCRVHHIITLFFPLAAADAGLSSAATAVVFSSFMLPGIDWVPVALPWLSRDSQSSTSTQLPVQVWQCGGWCPAVLCAVFTIVPRTVARPGTFFATSFVMHLAQGITSTTYEVAPQSLAHLTGLPGPSTPAYWHRHPGTALRCVGINALAYRSAGCCAIWVASGSPCTPWPGLWRVSHDCGLIGTRTPDLSPPTARTEQLTRHASSHQQWRRMPAMPDVLCAPAVSAVAALLFLIWFGENGQQQ